MSYASGNFSSLPRAHALFSRCKSVVFLLWALGYISELPPYDQQADPELTNELPTEPAQILIKKAVLRPQGSVEKQRDLAALWYWRSRTRQLQESNYKFTFPGDMTIQKVTGMASAKAATDGVIPSAIWGRLSCLRKGISGSDSCGILTTHIDSVGAAPCS